MATLPYDIWSNIVGILRDMGRLRDLTNLCKALDWKDNKKYIVAELMKSRNYRFQNYDEKMIELWERTGIDDGVPISYLKKHLHNGTRMYRTIWSSDLMYNQDLDAHVFYKCPAETLIGHNKILHLTNKVYVDNRSFKNLTDLLNRNCVDTWVGNFKQNLVLDDDEEDDF